MGENDKVKQKLNTASNSNADNIKSGTGVSLAAPPYQVAQGPKPSADKTKIDSKSNTSEPTKVAEPIINSTKDKLKKVYDDSFAKNKGNKEKAYDDLAKFIADQTLARRTTKSEYIILPNSIKLSGDAEVMNYRHNIGYWKDKPRRLKNASIGLYDSFSADTDASGNRTKGYGESHSDVKDEMEDIASITRSKDKTERIKENKLLKDNKSKHRVTPSLVPSTAKSCQDDKFAWSAMTISKIHHIAGSGDTFHYADAHVRYARKGKSNMKKDDISGIEKMHRAFNSPTLKKHQKSLEKNVELVDKYRELAEKFKAEGNEEKAKENISKAEKYEKLVLKYTEKVENGTATPVKIGDTLHRSRIKASTYEKIYKNTHSDVVIDIEVYEGNKGSLKKLGSYDDFIAKYSEALAIDEELSLEDFAKKKKYKVYAVAIGGNTVDFKDPDTAIPREGKGETLGKNYIPLNPNKTIKAKAGRNNKGYKKTEAYFGVQRTDYR